MAESSDEKVSAMEVSSPISKTLRGTNLSGGASGAVAVVLALEDGPEVVLVPRAPAERERLALLRHLPRPSVRSGLTRSEASSRNYESSYSLRGLDAVS